MNDAPGERDRRSVGTGASPLGQAVCRSEELVLRTVEQQAPLGVV
ncbi:MAG TPA: hypothetical protein VM736_06720 [Gemmatimonadales bacterium]|nr:hypothetical protein [Gemmatimonadales bacterium]